MSRPTGIEVLSAYYKAGIGVAAATIGVRIRTLGLEYDSGAKFGFSIEPLSNLIGQATQSMPQQIGLIEDYITVCLAGAAGRFAYSDARRGQVQRSMQGAAHELRQLRLLWECLEPESERAFIIALGTLPKLDEGDPEATMYRLWQRAHRLLSNNPQRTNLNRLARKLLEARQMTGFEVEAFLKRTN